MVKKILLGMAALTLMVTSCTENEVISDASNGAVQFTAYATTTRSDMTSDTFNASGNQFGVTGYYNNAVYLGKDCKQVYGTSWEYANASDLRFWPEASGAALDFYAYYPYTATASFLDSNAEGNVMTISGWTDGDDVMYAVAKGETYKARTPLTFKHALSKIKEVNVSTSISGFSITVNSVAFTATETAGTVNVDYAGAVTYSDAQTVRSITGLSGKTAVSGTPVKVFDNDQNAYIIPELTASDFWVRDDTGDVEGIAIKMNLTVKQNDATVYEGDAYIPTGATKFEAGKRYIFNINMNSGIGYDEHEDPILKPILFSAEVENWSDETAITINL